MCYCRVSTTLVTCDVPLLSIVTTYTPAAKSASYMLKSPATAAWLCFCNLSLRQQPLPDRPILCYFSKKLSCTAQNPPKAQIFYENNICEIEFLFNFAACNGKRLSINNFTIFHIDWLGICIRNRALRLPD